MTAPSVPAVLSALHTSYERLAAVVEPLTDDQLTGPSYDTEWSIAQVLSHLGSGAEIFTAVVNSAVRGEAPPALADFQQIWDVWNAKSPADQARDGLTATAGFLRAVEALSAEQREEFQVDLFGGPQELVTVLSMRLGEQAVHTWDVAVAVDPTAELAPDATELILENLSGLVGRAGKPVATAHRVEVSTTEPERVLLLTVGPDGAALHRAAEDMDGDAQLRLPAAALVRLAYGRLDPAHTPPVEATGVELDELRAAFPGF